MLYIETQLHAHCTGLTGHADTRTWARLRSSYAAAVTFCRFADGSLSQKSGGSDIYIRGLIREALYIRLIEQMNCFI